MNAPPHPTQAWYADHIVADVERFAAVVEASELDSVVPSCPDWTLAQLTRHTGTVHRWAGFCATEGRAPGDGEGPATDPYPGDDAEVATWFRRGGAAIAEVVRTLDPSAPTFHPFIGEQVAAIWPRRMAQETAMHRWDAENTVREASPIDATLASDGIDEYFEMALPRVLGRNESSTVAGSLHAHCTDVDGEWLVWFDDAGYHLVREHQKGDAALRGPAASILLRLWGRVGDDAEGLSPVGDEAVLAAWLAVAGV